MRYIQEKGEFSETEREREKKDKPGTEKCELLSRKRDCICYIFAPFINSFIATVILPAAVLEEIGECSSLSLSLTHSLSLFP